MKDCLGQEIGMGDTVAYASNSDGPCLSLGTVIGPCKNGNGSIRVSVTTSGTRAAQGLSPYGHRRLRAPGTPYVASIGVPERVVIVSRAHECKRLIEQGVVVAIRDPEPANKEKEST